MIQSKDAGLYKLGIKNRERGFKTNDSECALFKSAGFLLRRVGGMVGCNHVDGSVEDTLNQCFPVRLTPKRRIHLESSLLAKVAIVHNQVVVKLRNTSNTVLNVSVDGRYFANLSNNDECIVKMSDKKLKILTFCEDNMFATLFRKMRILEDIK